ncbi:TadE/TadG family type IV pilus assembly protein [Rhizobium paknamense]|uniref:Flp pilus assembly protein TadG n=1 Tax=Rhizobium paknamense TaxID=1206817 RepID=A0ABU0IDY8_9HYPH|nr:TadE/TadG family type IV pilus assembly protein [Rhizobium paknamense]MDQ0455424.1 Flp pilus assembly protein TadG [Rhizobium paknamense]
MSARPFRFGPLPRLLRCFLRDRSGMGAVEFAIVVPILLVLYLSAFELTVALSVSKRATASAGAIADIVARQTSVTKSFLATMPDVLTAMFVPFKTTGYTMKITGIKIDSNTQATVSWSWAQDGSKPYAVGSSVTMPTGMAVANSFFIHAEVTVPHQLVTYLPGLAGSTAATITLGDDYYYRQRRNEDLACSDC